MAVHHEAGSFIRAIEGRLQHYVKAAEAACDDLAKGEVEDYHELTSGTASYDDLRRQNNPYGRGFTNPRGKARGRRAALPINEHTGRLHDAARLVRRNVATGRFDRSAEWRLEVHGVPYARYVIPKKASPGSWTIYRGFWEEMDRRRRRRLFELKRDFKRRSRAA